MRRLDPYRTNDQEAVATRALPRELLYVIGGALGKQSLWRSPRALSLLVLPIVGVLAVGRTDAAPLVTGLVVLVVAIALSGQIPKRATPRMAGLLFRVVAGELEVASTTAPKTAVVRARLCDLRDVRLDTRQIRKVESAPEAGGQFMTHHVGPELDVARIQLLIEGRERPIPLTDGFVAHMDAMEWMGKIRTFLRASDWLPEDERTRIPMDSESGEEEDDDEKKSRLRERVTGFAAER